jgi:hypothetical protein
MATEHWTTHWLQAAEQLEVPVERWPADADLVSGRGRPIKLFVDGTLVARLRGRDDEVMVEFLSALDKAPRGCEKTRSGWQATFGAGQSPDAAVLDQWLELLRAYGLARVPEPEEEGPPEDAARWAWANQERLTEAKLYDRDRVPFSEHLAVAFTQLSGDEQKLLRTQWKREEMDEGPTVAEMLGWDGKQVMSTYRSAMASLRKAAAGYRRPKANRR